MILKIDDFLENYRELKAYSEICKFSDLENPSDGVVYPNICADIPATVRAETLDKLARIKGSEIEDHVMFLRMSPKGVSVPHMAHNDSLMGKFSLMLYLHENPESGTALLRHVESGISYQPQGDDYIKLVEQDQNNQEAWETYYKAYSKENRAAIFDAGFMHRAEPYGGFGENQSNSRIVLTCFFT